MGEGGLFVVPWLTYTTTAAYGNPGRPSPPRWGRPVACFPLPPADRRDLLDHYRRPVEPDVRLRAHILLLLDDGLPWATIRAVLFCSLGTIGRWKRRFEEEG